MYCASLDEIREAQLAREAPTGTNKHDQRKKAAWPENVSKHVQISAEAYARIDGTR